MGHVQAELGQLGRLDDRSHQEHQEPHRIQEWAVVQQSDGSFEIVNRKSDKLLDDYRWATASGSAVVQWADNDGANQHWTLTQTALPALTTGDYTIQNNLGKYLEIPGGSTASGMQADQWWYADQPWHLWHFVSANGGFRIINNNSGLALTDTHPASGEKITQAAVDSANANQIWTLVPHGNQFLVQNAGTGRCVTVAQGSSADLAKAVSWTETDTSDQLWTVRRIN
ncbi:RICIN domain-containing protein [Streptomyces sp. NPDC001634]|uniref:RICIN domain-containing protein n=1 Tax=Streptomyces sp. NPDC001634 TaxID=3154390 RepID=UPI00331AF3D0